jgi:hypothetical protein
VSARVHRLQFVGEQIGPGRGVGAVRAAGLGDCAVGDDAGLRFDGDGCLEPVLAAAHGLVRVPRLRVYDTDDSVRGATRWPIRQHPSVPSEPSTGSTSCPATRSSGATASAAIGPSSWSGRWPSSRCASPTSASTSSARAFSSFQAIAGLPASS